MRKFYLLAVLVTFLTRTSAIAQNSRTDTGQVQDSLILPQLLKGAAKNQQPFGKTPVKKQVIRGPLRLDRDPFAEVVIEGGGGGGGGGGGCTSYTWYKDADGDGYSDGSSVFQCNQPAYYKLPGQLIATSGDCNDYDASVHPGAVEIPDDGIDQNCNGYDLRAWYFDYDGDGYGSSFPIYSEFAAPGLVLNNSDCNDFDASIHPGATEIPDDGIDQDCDGYDVKTWYADLDGDGYGYFYGWYGLYVYSNTQPPGFVANYSDCNDFDPSIHSGATEIPDDGIDQDCDGYDLKTWYLDNDGDGYGNPSVTQLANAQPEGYVADHTDCDDSNAAVHPGATGDANCDGSLKTWYQDQDGDGYGNPFVHQTGSTQPLNYVSDNTDCDDTKASIHPGAEEIPDDGIDQDCDGYDLKTWYQDVDGDGYGNPAVHETSNTRPTDYVLDHTDCDDTKASIHPGAQEIPDDGVDQDCDGHDLKTWYQDQDGDSYGNASAHMTANTQPVGYVSDYTDCDDTKASIHPGAQEIPDDGVDQDCDGYDLRTWYRDQDGDTYGDASVHLTANTQPDGYVSDHTDCDDTNSSFNPGIQEIADDGIDQDCDGYDLTTWYKDFDGDGFGDPAVHEMANTQPPGYVDNNKDCDDHDASIHVGAIDIPDDGIDQNCDGADLKTWYQDYDGDGYGNPLVHEGANTQPPGYVSDHADCDDQHATVHPGAVEIPDDGIDQDCDGLDLKTWYQDVDGDGYGNPSVHKTANTKPAGYVSDHTDCDDTNAAIYPGAALSITAPTNKIVNTDPGSCAATNVVLGVANYANNCTSLTVTNDAPTTFPKGVTTVHWKLTDGNGATVAASQTITVVDNEKPKITCPTVAVQCYNTNGIYTIPGLVATDNCGIQSTGYAISGATLRSGSGNDASGAFNIGTSTITWTATDGSGNVSTCTSTVKVDKVDASISDVYASGITSSIGSPNTIYVGYGGSSIKLTAQVSSNLSPNTYTYKWTTGSPAGPGFATTQSITVSPSVTTTYYVSIKDVNGCAQAIQVAKQITVVDIRCGSNKIYVCQPKSGSYFTSCVSSSTKTISGLPAGSYLGTCVQSITAKKVIPEEHVFGVTANPNPTNESFTVKVTSAENDGPLTLKVFNINGQLVEMKKVNPMQTLRIGENYKRGIFLVEVTSARERKTLTLIKQ
jgi:putative metal-binding protein/type IX secretion system substrate protein